MTEENNDVSFLLDHLGDSWRLRITTTVAEPPDEDKMRAINALAAQLPLTPTVEYKDGVLTTTLTSGSRDSCIGAIIGYCLKDGKYSRDEWGVFYDMGGSIEEMWDGGNGTAGEEGGQ